LNPILGNTAADAAFGRLYSDVLVSEDASGRLVPDLAAEVPTIGNGGISADGLTIRYKLRTNVKWQDGQPFTSADVKFTFDAVMNPANDVSGRVGFDDVSRVDVPDARTIVFHLRHRYAPFVTTVFGDGCGVLPAHILAREKTINDVSFNAAPVGTGPFRVVRWERGNRIELRRNDEYLWANRSSRASRSSSCPTKTPSRTANGELALRIHSGERVHRAGWTDLRRSVAKAPL
jgi:peptide/nickel transport system substrate-binding protein